MRRNIKFDESVYENDIKNLNSKFDELMKRKTMKKAYKKYLMNKEKEISNFNCFERSTYNKLKFDLNGYNEKNIINKSVNLKTNANNNNLETDYKFEKGFC